MTGKFSYQLSVNSYQLYHRTPAIFFEKSNIPKPHPRPCAGHPFPAERGAIRPRLAPLSAGKG
jgi:hypothetical protein